MKLYNCRLDELQDKVKGQKLILFGIGEYFELYVKEALSAEVMMSVAYAIDNNRFGSELQLFEKCIPIYQISKLREEDRCVVIICGNASMYEMYEQLRDMNLCDDIICYVFPLIMVKSVGKSNVQIKEHMQKTKSNPQIEKVIHCFWFSGDKKPEAYQKCIDSWKRACPDYEIKEWNMNNYDYTKNHFMYQAIKEKKWAFASDYARLDVIYHQGGIYLDIDVELLHSMDGLLGNEAFFAFDTQHNIDLAVFAAKAANPLIKKLMELYNDIEFSGDAKTMSWFCQPRYIRAALKEAGVSLNGDLQMINGMAFLPRNYFEPQDYVIYELSAMSEETLAIHRHNAGWKNDDYHCRRQKIIDNNRKLWNLAEQDRKDLEDGIHQ